MTSENVFERPAKKQRRVVVTGMGMVSPVGNTLEDSWKSVINGQSGIDRITQFDPDNFGVQIAGEVTGLDIEAYVPKKEQKKMDRFIHLTLAATEMALKHSGLNPKEDEKLAERSGAIVGVGIGGLQGIESAKEVLDKRGPHRISPFFIPHVITNMAAGHVTINHGLKGPNYSVTSACATGAHSIGEAAKYIRDGICDMMVAGGSEGSVTQLAVSGFAAMKALSTRNSQPQMASRPFDKDRDGFVLSEGAGIVILEDYESASRRGATIYAEVTGYGASSDAHHMTNPAPGGAGAMMAMKRALEDAQIDMTKIGYVNAHGTSTPVGDEIESQAIEALFGDHAKNVWVSSTKSMTGHTLGAAGAIESIFSIMALDKGIAPPTINLDEPSEGCNLDYVPHTARERNFDAVLNNSFGFGGTNASVIFTKV